MLVVRVRLAAICAMTLLALLGLPSGVVTAARADLFSTTFSGASVATALQQSLGATSIHLHTLGSLVGDRYYAANASSIKVPASVSGVPGQRTYFSLPDESWTVLGRRYGYYVNHIRSTGVFVAANADSFTISIALQADGPALVGTCVQLRRPARPCAIGGEGVLPGIIWQDARIDITAKPIVQSRSLALDVQSVVLVGDFELGQACAWPLIGKRVCATLNRQTQQVRDRVAAQVKAALNTDDIRRVIATGVRGYLDTNLNEPLLGIRRVAMQDGQLTFNLGFGR